MGERLNGLEIATLELTSVSGLVILLSASLARTQALEGSCFACLTRLRIAGGDSCNGAREGSKN